MRSIRVRHAARVAAVAVVAAVGAAPSAQQPPVFRAGTRTVSVYATVTEQDGRLVTDLARDDFQIDDNGERQAITLFANDIQPITVVMMLDRSGSMRANFRLVREAAEQFVLQMLPADKARIGSFSNRIQVDPRDFTSDQGELLEILRTQLQEAGPTPLWNAVNVGMTALLHQTGRRVVVVFTDGVDAPGRITGNNVSLNDAMRRAQQEEVMVYAIGLAGQNPSGGRRPGGSRRGGFGFGAGSRGGDGKPDEGLAKIAGETGGGYFELTNTADLASTFTRVADELHHQYVLGFTPEKLDGKMHKLEVKLARPELVARARKNYLAKPDRYQ